MSMDSQAPLSREQILDLKNLCVPGIRLKCYEAIKCICDMALSSLTRPVPPDVTEDVECLRSGIKTLASGYNVPVAPMLRDSLFQILDRIIAAMGKPTEVTSSKQGRYTDGSYSRTLVEQPTEAKPSVDAARAEEIAQAIHDYPASAVEYIQQAISAARAEGLEEAAKFIDGGYSGTSHVAERIRALIPTPQQTEGKP